MLITEEARSTIANEENVKTLLDILRSFQKNKEITICVMSVLKKLTALGQYSTVFRGYYNRADVVAIENVREILHEYGAEELFNSILNEAGKQLRKLINVSLKRLSAGNKSKGDDEDFEFDELDRRLQELSDQVEKQPEQYEAKKRDLEKLPPVSPPGEGRQENDASHLEEERQRKEEEAKKAEAEKQRAEEERVKQEQEAKRLEEEKRKQEEEKKKQEEEKKKAAEEQAKKELEEKQRLEEEKRKQEQARKEEEERLKKEQEAKRAEEEKKKQEEEKKKQEEERKKAEAEAKRVEEEKKKQEEERKKQEEEAKRKREAEEKQKQTTQAAPATKSPAVPRAKESQETERKALLSAWKEITGGNKQQVPGLKGSGSAPNISTQASASKAATASEVKVKQLVGRIEKFVPETSTGSTHSAPTDPANVSERASTSSLARNEKYRNILSFWHLKDAEASANTTQK